MESYNYSYIQAEREDQGEEQAMVGCLELGHLCGIGATYQITYPWREFFEMTQNPSCCYIRAQ